MIWREGQSRLDCRTIRCGLAGQIPAELLTGDYAAQYDGAYIRLHYPDSGNPSLSLAPPAGAAFSNRRAERWGVTVYARDGTVLFPERRLIPANNAALNPNDLTITYRREDLALTQGGLKLRDWQIISVVFKPLDWETWIDRAPGGGLTLQLVMVFAAMVSMTVTGIKAKATPGLLALLVAISGCVAAIAPVIIWDAGNFALAGLYIICIVAFAAAFSYLRR